MIHESATRARTDEFEKLLLARKDEIVAGIDASGAELLSIRSSRTSTNADDEHDPEGSTLAADWSRIAGLRSEAVAQLNEVDRALERVHDGTYGVCLRCGRQIPVGRLRIRPWAEQCVECAAR